MKLIYLDYDGVILHSMSRSIAKSMARHNGEEIPTGRSHLCYDMDIVKVLWLLQQENPDLCYVCSSRAHGAKTKEEQELPFRMLGYPLEFHNLFRTQRLSDYHREVLTDIHGEHLKGNRGLEILVHQDVLGLDYKTSNYLVVDDSSDYPPIPDEKFIHVVDGEFSGGMNITHFCEIKKRLGLK